MLRKAFIILLLAVAAASAVAAAAWQAKGDTVMAGARSLIEREVTTALGSSVSIGDIEINGMSSVAVKNIILQDKQGDLAGTADSLTVTFNPLLLLTQTNPFDAIHSVTLQSPQVYLRQRPDQSWNLEDFIQGKKTGSAQFGGKVAIHDGRLSVKTQKQGSYEADSIDGTLDFGAKPSVLVDLEGKHNGSPFTAEGSVNGKTRDALTLRVDSLSLSAYQAALPASTIRIDHGEAQQVVLTVLREKEEYRFNGEAVLTGVTGEANTVPFAVNSALVNFDQDAVHVYKGDTQVWNQPLLASGVVTYTSSTPVFDFTLQSSAFDSGVLPVAVPVSGQAAFTVTLQGTADAFQASGDISMATGAYREYAFSNATAQFVYQDGLLRLQKAELSLFGGRVAAKGVIDTSSLQSDLHLTGQQLDGTLLAEAAAVKQTSGRVDFDVLLRGELALAGVEATGTVTIGSGQVACIPFDSAYGGIHLRQGLLTVNYLNAAAGTGMVSSKGTLNVTNNRLAFDLEGYNLPVSSLTANMPDPIHASGLLRFNGQISGSINAPQLTVVMTAERGEVLGQPFAKLTGEADISREWVKLRGVQLVNGPTTHKLDGMVQLAGQHEINLVLATRKARMEELLKPMPITERITGNVDHDLTVTGTLENPAAEGWLVLSDGSWRDYLLSGIKGSYRYRDGQAEIQSVVVNSLDNQVVVDGKITRQGDLAMQLIGNDIDLSRLPVSYPYPVSGTGKITASLAGTLSAPQLTGQIFIPALSINSQVLEKVEAGISLSGSQLDCSEATFTQGHSAYRLSGGINLVSHEIYGLLTVDKAQLSTIASLIKMDAKTADGELNGQFSWNGTLDNPGASFSGTVAKGVVKGYSLGDVELEAKLANQVITLENLMVKQSSGVMAARGQIDLKGDINIEAGARDIDAAFFSKIFESALETKGSLNFTAQITGKTANPHTALSLDIVTGSVGNASFDKLYGLFVMEQGRIQVEQLLLSKGEYKASAYGVIPFAALNPEGRKKATTADQLDLTFRLDQANLSILPVLTKTVTTASGETKGEVKVTGNLFQPELNGQITVKDGTIKFADIQEPIQKVTVDIQFKGDTIQVRTFEGSVGTGSYRLAGSAVWRDMALHNYDMALELNKISLTHKYFKGPVVGTLTLKEEKNLPHIAGKLLLANTTVNVPLMSLSSNDSPLPNLAMNVELDIGDKVRLYNPSLYDVWVEGKVLFNGTLAEPDISGKIESRRGTLTYLQTQFRIDEATASFTQFRSFEPVLALKASTRLEQTDVNLAVNGPATAMDLRLTSNPQMNQQEIFSLLTLRSKYSQTTGKRESGLGRDELVSMLDAGLQMQFFAEVETMFRNSLGVDEFRLTKGSVANPLFSSDRTTNQDQYKVEIGKYITDRIMLNYSTGVNSSEQSYGVRYDLTKSISLSADVDEYDGLRVGIGMKLRF